MPKESCPNPTSLNTDRTAPTLAMNSAQTVGHSLLDDSKHRETAGILLSIILYVSVFVCSACAYAGIDDGYKAYYAGDFAKAFKKWKRLADAGDSRAMLLIGVLYENGEGVPQNYKNAFLYFKKANAKGDIEAKGALGKLYLYGLGIDQDCQLGRQLLLRSASAGVADAQFELGMMFRDGKVSKTSKQCAFQDQQQALQWFRKAAEQGHAFASYILGRAYEMGNGIKQNSRDAFYWYCRSAVLGDELGKLALASAYESGTGVTQNKAIAHAVLTQLASHDYPDAAQQLEYLESAMSPDELNLARGRTESNNVPSLEAVCPAPK